MDISVEKEMIKRELDQIQDVELIAMIRSMLDFAKGKSSAASYKPMTEDKLFNRLTESRKAIAEGKLISQDEVKNYFKNKNNNNKND